MKIVGVVWQSYYNIFLKASKNIKDFDINIYSARSIEAFPEKFDILLKDIKDADILFFYRSAEPFWEKLEKELKQDIDAKIICLGHDPSYLLLSNVDADIINKSYKYIVMNGEKNITNLYLYLANKLCNLKIHYEEPENIPWEGIYHPDSNTIFSKIEDYLAWYNEHIGIKKDFIGILFSRHYWINENTEVEDLLIKSLEKRGFGVICAFSYSVKDIELGTKSSGEVIRDYFIDTNEKPRISAFIKLISFFLEKNRGSDSHNACVASDGVKLLERLNIPVFGPISSYYTTISEWEKGELSLDTGWSVALPEFEGIIEPIIISAQMEGEEEERRKMPIEDRVEKLLDRIVRWIDLRKLRPQDKKIAFILHNSPCSSVEATVGGAAHLDSLESVVRIMKRLKSAGYRVEPPQDGKELIDLIMKRKAISEFRWTTVEEIVEKGGVIAFVDKEKYLEWFSELDENTRNRMIEAWGNPPGEYKNGIPPAMVYNGKIVITGISLGNVVVCVQPKRGCAGSRCDGQVCKILHDPDVPPPHQYIATYKWLSKEFKANAIVHVGTHGNLEFLPGKGVGLSSSCFPDIAIDSIPHLYIYNADNPPEGTIAKRRSYAVLIDHMQTTMTKSGLYEELLELDRLVSEYHIAKKNNPVKAHALEHIILDSIKKTNLDKEIKVKFDGKHYFLSDIINEDIHQLPFDEITEKVHAILSNIRNSQIQDGMHIFGDVPKGTKRIEFIYSILKYHQDEEFSIRRKIASIMGYDLDFILANQHKTDETIGRSYGYILEQIDEIGKEVVTMVIGGV